MIKCKTATAESLEDSPSPADYPKENEYKVEDKQINNDNDNKPPQKHRLGTVSNKILVL